MADVSLKKLRAQASMALRNGDLEDALAASTTVIATSKCWVLALPRKQRLRLTQNNPKAEAVIKQKADERASESAGYGWKPFDSGSSRTSVS